MLPCLATSLLALAAFHAPAIPTTPASHAAFGTSPAALRNSAVRPRNSPLVAVAEAPTYGADVPYAEASYDAAAAATFFRARPLATIGRLAQIALLSGGFVASLVVDKALKREEDPALVELRSQQLLELVTKLGPTFIKIGQALSIRSDLVPAAYVAGLAQLQDAVPPFDGAQGRAIIEAELGLRRIEDAFSSPIERTVGAPEAGATTGIVAVHPYAAETIPGSVQLTDDGLYAGGDWRTASTLVEKGMANPFRFRLFAQATRWQPGELEKEIQGGAWLCADVSTDLLLKDRDRGARRFWRRSFVARRRRRGRAGSQGRARRGG